MKRKENKPLKKIDQIMVALEVLIKDDFRLDATLISFADRLEKMEKLMSIIISWHKDLKSFEEQIFKDNLRKYLES